MSKYGFIARLGHGAFGMVVKAKENEGGRIVAIKQINLKTDAKSQMEVFREISCLRNSNHENIVHLIDVVYQNDHVSLVMEFCESNLKLVIADVIRPLTESIMRFYFRQILYGVAYLHHIRIMHRDLKPDNILITSQNKVKIADFGLACIYFPNDKTRVYNHQVATRWYRAPELLFGATRYTPKVDIWAIGCIMAEYLNGVPVFAGTNDIDQLVKVFQVLGTPTDRNWPGWELLPDSGKVLFEPMKPVADWTSVVPLASPECLHLIRSILQLNSQSRPDALRSLQADFFTLFPKRDSITYKPPSIEDVQRDKNVDQEIIFNRNLDINQAH